jgi:4-hydroxy-4-methyl-2-oxoglutarate aldolase
MILDTGLLARAASFSPATLHEAMGRIGALPMEIKPIARGMRLCGPALTVRTNGHENLTIHRAIAQAEPGSVLVVDVAGRYEGGYFGEIMTVFAQQRRLGGLVIDGCVRDLVEIEQLGFPVFARGLAIVGTGKAGGGEIGGTVFFPATRVEPGDLVVGDDDGLVVVPQASIGTALDAAAERMAKEARTMEQLRAGRTTLEIYGWS